MFEKASRKYVPLCLPGLRRSSPRSGSNAKSSIGSRLKRSSLISAYTQGAGTTQLAEDFAIHRTTVWAHLERAGIPRRPATRKLTDDQIQRAAEHYATGLSLADIARKFGVDPETIRKEYIRAGIPRRT